MAVAHPGGMQTHPLRCPPRLPPVPAPGRDRLPPMPQPSDPRPPLPAPSAARRRALRVAGYLALVVAITWPLALHPASTMAGFPNVDAQDTVMLRGLLADLFLHPWQAPHSQQIYFPTGFPVLHLTPNLLDHITAAPFVWLLPFPLADNLWWALVLLLNGLAGHHLGRTVGRTEAAGWVAGVGWLTAEPLLREANLHHAPQAMTFFAPLYLAALVRLWQANRDGAAPPGLRGAAAAAAWLGLASLAYWYQGLFLVLGTLPLLVGLRWRQWLVGAAVLLAVCGPFLLPQLFLWDDLPLTAGRMQPAPARADASFSVLPDAEVFVAQHASDLLFWLRRVPMDLTNRVSLVLLAAAALGWRRLPRGLGWCLAVPSLVGAVMVLGPYLRWGEGLVVVGDSVIQLPFQIMRDLHPFLARLTWSERFGMLIPLGLVALAARAPRAAWLAAAIGLENLAVSANAPLQSTSVKHQLCWADVPSGDRAMMVLPFRRAGLRAPRVGVHRRMHRRPVVNPVLLPPGAETPREWGRWLEDQALIRYLIAYEEGDWPPDPGPEAVRSLREAGVGVIAIDVEPGGPLTGGGMNRYRTGLTRHLGPPVDLGCALVWWLDPDTAPPAPHPDPEGFRAEAAAWKEAHPAPALDTLIQPTWDTIQNQRPAAKGAR